MMPVVFFLGGHGQRTLQAPQTMQWAVRQREQAVPGSRTAAAPAAATTGNIGKTGSLISPSTFEVYFLY